MNRPPVNSFDVLTHIHSFEMVRNTRGYEEVSVLDIHHVLSNGHLFYSATQREGTEVSCNFNVRTRGHMSISEKFLSKQIDIWRAAWLTGESLEIIPSIGHIEFASALQGADSVDNFRIVIRGAKTNNLIGYITWAPNERYTVTYGVNDACIFRSWDNASLLMTGLQFQDQTNELRESVESIFDTHQEDVVYQIQKEVGNSWVDQSVQEKAPPYHRYNGYFNKIKQY